MANSVLSLPPNPLPIPAALPQFAHPASTPFSVDTVPKQRLCPEAQSRGAGLDVGMGSMYHGVSTLKDGAAIIYRAREDWAQVCPR